jgi:energy-converting hydrogenase B subunit D
MSFFQAILLIFIAITGAGIVFTRQPVNQAIVLSFFGLLLAILFLIFQAPDVALSEVVVGTIALPLMILLTMAKLKYYARLHKEVEEEIENPDEAEQDAGDDSSKGALQRGESQ